MECAEEAVEDASMVVEPPLSQEDADLLQEAVEGETMLCHEEIAPPSPDSEDEMRELDDGETISSPSAFQAVHSQHVEWIRGPVPGLLAQSFETRSSQRSLGFAERFEGGFAAGFSVGFLGGGSFALGSP